MTTVSETVLAPEKKLNNVTFNFANEIGGERWETIAEDIEDHLTKSNLDNSINQTQGGYLNEDSHAFDIPNLDQLLIIPPFPQSQEYFNVKQKWEGYVLEVGQDTFRARLVPIVGEDADLEAEIYLADVEEPDQVLVKPGAVFYWSIGYAIRPSGNRYQASFIRFRRLPPMSKEKLGIARAKAKQLMSLFDEG